MTHPIVALQGALVGALRADAGLIALIGAGGVFDAPPKGRDVPYVLVARHDLLPRDGDDTPGYEHRLLIHAWAAEASRKAVLAIVDRVLAVALAADLDGAGLVVTNRVHERTDTAIDVKTGRARAAVALRMFSEPAS
jgi:hypothetical protein